jgi:N,N'-diacetyllegionaminate synthase
MAWSAQFRIGRAVVGGGRCFVVAEIGSNHDGSLERAVELMSAAREAGADAVKFQLFSPEGLVARRVRDDRGRWRPNPVFAALEPLATPLEWLPALWKEAGDMGVEFLATPFDEDCLKALVDLGAGAVKIASGDLTHHPLLRAAAAARLPILLSRGMSEEAEIARALEAISGAGGEQVALLHCVSRYPPDDEEMNLRAVGRLAERFGTPVGLSDHGPGATAALGAVALGACVVEKHFTLDRALPGPDHAFAMTPGEFAEMTREIRRLEAMLGSGRLGPSERERDERRIGRRSVVAARPLKAGEILSSGDVKCVRPGGGLSPEGLDGLMGRRLSRDLEEDEPL